MEKTESLQSNLEDGIVTITLKTDSKSFSLTDKSLNELRNVIQRVYDDDAIEGVIITGEGEEIFSLGTDVSELLKLNELNARKFAEHGQEVLAFIEDCPKPILAAVNGYALGSGFELALACHFRFASENAVFAFPEITFGVIPGFGGTQRLTQLLGKTKALEYLMTGKRIYAKDAERMGVVSDVVSYKEEMLKKAKKWLTAIANNADLALGMLVTCVNAAENPDENGFQTEANGFANCFKEPDLKEKLMKTLGNQTVAEQK